VTAVALAFAALLTAAQPARPVESAPAAPVALPAALEQEAKAIERMVIAPCCWMQPVSDHQSSASDEVKQQIRAWLAARMTRQQILDAFVERYGARILAEPPNRGFSRFLYVTPVAVFGLSAVGLVVLVKHMVGRRRPATPDAGEPNAPSRLDAAQRAVADSDAALEERLDDELRELD
jgi:cytochrome c-type biogenesis protein CcmH/NrfF